MNYKKQIKDNYTLHLINNNRFKTINIDVYFSSLFNKKDIPYLHLLVKFLVHSSKKYNTKNKMASMSEELYNSLIISKSGVVGKLENLLISLEFINPMYTEEKMYDDTIDFLYEVIFNPNIKDKEFDKKTFELCKNNLINEINNSKKNPNVIAYENFSKEMYKGTSASNGVFGDIKNYEKIDSKDLYNFYLKLIKTFKLDIVITGEIDEDKITYLINQKFRSLENKNNKIENIYNKTKIKDKVLIKKDEYKFNQSHLLIGYKLENLSDYELKYVLTMYNTILGSMNNSILFTKVREEHSYCYHISSSVSRFNSSLVIVSGINRKNYDGALKVIKECVKLMNNENIIKRLFNTALGTINTFLNDYYDNPYEIMEHYYIKEFINSDDIEERREKYKQIKIEDIINLNKKLKLDTIYFMEGTNE